MSEPFCDALATEAASSLTSYIESCLLFTFKMLKKNRKKINQKLLPEKLKMCGKGRMMLLEPQKLSMVLNGNLLMRYGSITKGLIIVISPCQ
jgi:hypothetical protein